MSTLKDKKLRHILFTGNPFVEEVEAYRIWIISNCAKLVDLDGDKVTPRATKAKASSMPATDYDHVFSSHRRPRRRVSPLPSRPTLP